MCLDQSLRGQAEAKALVSFPELPITADAKATNTRLENRSALQGLSEISLIGGGNHCLIMRLECLLCMQACTEVDVMCLSQLLLQFMF